MLYRLPIHGELLANFLRVSQQNQEVLNDLAMTLQCVGSPCHRCCRMADDRTLKLWDIQTGDCLRTFEGHSAAVNSVAVLADGQRALSASGDGTLKLWDIETGTCLYTFHGDNTFFRCALSADGRTVVAGDEAGGVSFLRLEGL